MKSRKEKDITGGLSCPVDSRTDSFDTPLLFILSYILSTCTEVRPVPVLSGCGISKGAVFKNTAQFWLLMWLARVQVILKYVTELFLL